MVGALPQALSSQAFLEYLKAKMCLPCIRHTAPIARPIKRVAVCGGSGSFLIQEAILKQIDVLVTADVKYHDFFKAEGQILIVDIGHYESEVGTKALIHTLLSEKFASIVFLKCKTVTNPIHYL
jgi:putative NIF3 family GTP cyclohydrolase 1 type 2